MSTPRNKPIDLSKCKVGQRVRLRNKEIVKIEQIDRHPSSYPVKAGGSWYTWDGFYHYKTRSSSLDIVAILPPAKKAKKPAKKANTLERFTDAFAKIAFKGDNDLIRKAADQLKGLLKP